MEFKFFEIIGGLRIVVLVTFQVNLCPTIFATSWKRVLDRRGPYMSKHKPAICWCLWSVASLEAISLYSLCRGLKFLLKVPYIVQDYFKVDKFLFFESLCLGRKYCLISEKKISQKLTAFVFGKTQLHQTSKKCVSNQWTHLDVLIW